jgi:hypothetical protein
MKDDMDIEKLLKQYRSDPSPRVKQRVMNRYGRIHGGGRPFARDKRWLTRPVPFYLFAVGILVAIGLSFFAGKMTSPQQNQQSSVMDAQPASIEDELKEVQWEVAPNDLI